MEEKTPIFKRLAISMEFLGFLTGYPSRKMGGICSFSFFFFSVSGKVSPITPLLSGIFVRAVHILVGFQGIVERRRFLWFDTVEYFINLQWRRRLKRK